MGKGSARTLKYWLDKGYTGEEAEKMRMSRVPGTIEYFHIFKKMSLSEAKKSKEEYQSKRAVTLENMIRKYGDIEGEIRWQEYKDKQAYTNSFEYKEEKYGWTMDEWENYNKSRGSFGEKNGNYGTSYYEVWVEKYGKDEADRMNKEVSKLKARSKEKNGNYRRKKRPEEIERMKKSAIERVIRQGTCVAYNVSSIPIIENFGKENGYYFQHAENGGEYQIPNTTFFVDGYDKENNVVIEFDEKYHFSENQKKKDLERQDMIGHLLKCKFIRIDEHMNVKIIDYSNQN